MNKLIWLKALFPLHDPAKKDQRYRAALCAKAKQWLHFHAVCMQTGDFCLLLGLAFFLQKLT